MLLQKLFFFCLGLILMPPSIALSLVPVGANRICYITSPAKIAFINAGNSLDFACSAELLYSGLRLYNWEFGEYGVVPGTSTEKTPGKIIFKEGGHYKVTLTVKHKFYVNDFCQATRHVLVYDSNDPREFCEGYADISEEQNKENKKKNCGYSGDHWHNDEYKHTKWCRSVSLDQARGGLRDRDEKLRKCTGNVDTPDDPGDPQGRGSGGNVINIGSGGVRIESVADSRVYAYSYRNWNKANWGKYEILTSGWHPTGGESRAYLKFDLSGIDPKNVGKATLKLFHYHTGGNNSLSVGVHAVTTTWQEGSDTYHSGQTEKPAAPGEISWVAQPSFNPYQSANFKPGPETNKHIEVDITQLVKQWLSGVANNGLVLKATGNLNRSIPASTYGFYSREHKDTNKHPVLILSASSLSGSDTPAGGINPVKDYKSIVGIPCGTDREFVYSMFQCIFERDPEEKEVNEQIRDLQKGMSRKDIVVRFFKSDEYNSKFYDSKSNGYYWTEQTWNSFYKDAYQAVFGLNRNFNSSSHPRTYHHWVVAQLFDSKEYRNLCPGNNDSNEPEQENEYNPLEDTGLKISDKIEADQVDDLVNKYQDSLYHNARKDDEQQVDAVVDQPAEYLNGDPDDTLKPATDNEDTDEPNINIPVRKCADNAKDAYQQYLPAYNKLTQLMQQGEGDTPRAQRAYENYKFYKDCYEAFTKTSPAH